MATHQSNLKACIHSVWLRGQRFYAIAGALSFLRWGFSLFIVGMLIDWQTFMPKPGRVAIFAVMLGMALYKAWRNGWKDLSAFSARNTALQIEERLGRGDSLLVTAAQFSTASVSDAGSSTMKEVTCLKAEEEARKVMPSSVVTANFLKKPALHVLLLAAVLSLVGVISFEFLGAGAKRLLPPWLSAEYPTRTTIKMTCGDLLTKDGVETHSGSFIVKEGDQTAITADILGVQRKTAEIRVRPEVGKPFERKIPVSDGKLNYEIASAYRSFSYRIFAGDDRTDWKKVTVIAAPRIDRAEVTLTFPAYTGRSTETIDALTVTVPEGSEIAWTLYLDRPVSAASMRTAIGETNTLDVSDDGLIVSMSQTATKSSAYSFAWIEKSKGYSFSSPKNYIEVQPDEAPQVELTKPGKNVFATLGREVKLAYRARDDHGIGGARICFEVNKVEEKTVSIDPPTSGQQGEVAVDWDYRETLKNLAVGDSVTFVIEMADRYPGEDGPHTIRSQGRRLSILSKRDYLIRMDRQRVRLLSQVKNIYREERGIHYLVKEFDPASGNFIQTCQMEVVRQELIKERLLEIKQAMAELVDDLAANGFTEPLYTAELTRLQGELQRIVDDHIALVSKALKALAIASTNHPDTADTTDARDAINVAARELGIMVLQLGFKEATEVMAREIQVIAEDQAHLRWRVIDSGSVSGVVKDDLTTRQAELADWLLRLLGAIPADRESKEEDALVAFKLSRLRKDLGRASTARIMRKAADSIGTSKPEVAADLQMDVINALLKAEFRLRRGLEYSALLKAKELFKEQVAAQKELRAAITEMSVADFKARQTDVREVQRMLSKRLALLLMPEIPAPRCKLLDAVQPPKPKVDERLADSVRIQDQVSMAIEASDRDKAVAELGKAGENFQVLADIVQKRIDHIYEERRIVATAAAAGSQISKIGGFAEQLSSIIEKTGDARAYETPSAFIIPLLNRLALDLISFKTGVIKQNKRIKNPPETIEPLVAYIANCAADLRKSATAVKNKKLDEAIELQEKVEETFEQMVALLTTQSADVGSLSTALSSNRIVNEPGPLMRDIMFEQHDMVKVAKATEDDDLPKLAIEQKNLVHAVNAVLTYLDPFAHHIETGSVMLFAKEDMNAAAIGMQQKDRAEALDAGSFVAESIQKIIDQIDRLAPQYTYSMELVEFIHEGLSERMVIQALQKQLAATCTETKGRAAVAKLTAKQGALLKRSKTVADRMVPIIGMSSLVNGISNMEEALKNLKAGDAAGAAEPLSQALSALDASNAELLRLSTLVPLVLEPPIAPAVPPEFSFLVDFTGFATRHKELYRKTNLAPVKHADKLAAQQIEILTGCDLFTKRYATLRQKLITARIATIKASYSGRRPPDIPMGQAVASKRKALIAFFSGNQTRLATAKSLMQTAASKLSSGTMKDAIAAQRDAADQLRKFYLSNILMFIQEPGPPPDNPPAPSFSISMVDDFMLTSPGSVSGRKIKGGRLEWNVLGRRDRAALNENFARELPLEYRGILKNYYERLAK